MPWSVLVGELMVPIVAPTLVLLNARLFRVLLQVQVAVRTPMHLYWLYGEAAASSELDPATITPWFEGLCMQGAM